MTADRCFCRAAILDKHVDVTNPQLIGVQSYMDKNNLAGASSITVVVWSGNAETNAVLGVGFRPKKFEAPELHS